MLGGIKTAMAGLPMATNQTRATVTGKKVTVALYTGGLHHETDKAFFNERFR